MIALNIIRKLPKLGLIGLFVVLISGCSSALNGERYRNIEPALDIINFFTGETKAWGIVQDYSGNMTQQFTVDLIGTVANQNGSRVLTLDETFHYQVGDGMKKRIWTLTQTPDGKIIGNAGDILGSATGTTYGNAFQFVYEMDLPVDDSTFRVTFDDWIWAFDEHTIINRSYIKKWGITVAEVTIFMQKQ